MALATDRMCTGYRQGDKLDDDLLREVADLAQVVTRAFVDEGLTRLAAVVLILPARRGRLDDPARPSARSASRMVDRAARPGVDGLL